MPRALAGKGDCGSLQPHCSPGALNLSPWWESRAELGSLSVPSHLRHVIVV